jgi:uncharacterized membrane protein YjjB (DUF3815 family)
MTPDAIILGMLHNVAIALLVASLVVGLAGVGVAFLAFDRFGNGRPYPPRAIAAGATGAAGIIVALILLAVG